MPFVARTREFLSNPQQFLNNANISTRRQDEMIATINFLLQQAGSVNLDRIVEHLISQGHAIGPTQWQQEVLDPLRDSGVFIGSSNRGYFIPRDRDQAIDAYRFYVKRIIAESQRSGILADLIRRGGWGLPNIQID
ncbi:MAG: hypothetical protein WC578_06695 [Candidatus Omnitrophota bacterium]|jgi:hypothetical protein